MPPQRPPSSPTSLLWAHQLKREHGFLLDRMNKLEAEIAGVESRTKAAVDTSGANGIATMTKMVQSLTNYGGGVAMEKIREEVMERFEHVGADIEAVTIQVSNLERSEGVLEEESRRVAQSEEALLKRIKEMEGATKEYERSLLKLGRKVDDQAIGKVRDGLVALNEDVKNNRIAVEMVHASLETLDEASKELRDGNARLADQVKELTERPVYVAAPAAALAPIPAVAGPLRVQRDSEEEEEDPPFIPLPAKKSTAAKKKTAVKVAPKVFTIATRKPTSKKQGAATRPPTGKGVARTRPTKEEPLIDERLKVPIVRQGRGWVEVEEDPGEGRDVLEASNISERTKRGSRRNVVQPARAVPCVLSTPPAKRGPGRPRKEHPTAAPAPQRSILQPDEVHQLFTDLPSTSSGPQTKRGPGRPKKTVARRTIVQTDDDSLPAKTISRKRLPNLNDSKVASKTQSAFEEKNMKVADPILDWPEPPRKKQRPGLTGISTSTMSSLIDPMGPIEPVSGPSQSGHVFQSETSQQSSSSNEDTLQVQPPKRRTIVQLDDETIPR